MLMILVIVWANICPKKPQTNNTKQQCNFTCFLENKNKDTMILDHSFLYSGEYFNKSWFYFLGISICNIEANFLAS